MRNNNRNSSLLARHLGVALIVVALTTTSTARACDACAASIQLPINTGLQLGQLTFLTAAVVAAIGMAGGGSGMANAASVIASQDGAKSAAGMAAAADFKIMSNTVQALTDANPNMQSTNCRLATKNALSSTVEDIASSAKKSLRGRVVDGLLFNNAATPQRIAAGAIYRLCQNGQLRRTDFGPAWFDANNCIEDNDHAHDFLKISTILDSPVLIPVTGNSALGVPRMDVLDNPERYAPADVAIVWNSLNDKQKKYVGAVRYCENLVISKIRPQTIRNDAALKQENQAIIANNQAATAAVLAASDVCRAELARRVAIDPDVAGFGGSAAHRANLKDKGRKVVNLLINQPGGDVRGDVRELYAYATQANYNANTPIMDGAQPKIWLSKYIEERHARDYGRSIDCVGYADTGSGAEKMLTMINCATMVATWEKNDALRKQQFIAAVASIDQTPDYADAVAASSRANYNSTVPGQGLVQPVGLGSLDFSKQPLLGDELLQTIGTSKALTGSAHSEAPAND